MDIDLVYLWVDDTDYNWKRKFMKYTGHFSDYDEDAINPCRFYNNDELKYSLRSAEKYAPWIRKIFIVTDNQIPEWLDTTNNKVRVVDHKEIIPEKYLPLFNSCAIETRIPFINGLSEYFLYANDDMFFWNPVDENFFFENGKPICRMDKFLKRFKHKRLYGKTISNAYNLVIKKYKCNFEAFYPHHNIDAYKKSVYLECINEFKAEFEQTLNNRFREESDVQRSIVSFYALAKSCAILRKTRLNLFQILIGKHSESSQYNLKKQIPRKVIKSKSKLVCFNDSIKTTDTIRNEVKNLLKEKFPDKSGLER